MKKLHLLILSSLLITLFSCENKRIETKNNQKSFINVGVFDGLGGAQTCKWEAFESIMIDTGMVASFISSADISNGCLDTLDAIIIPGGGGSRQYLNLGIENQRRIKEFVKDGNGAIGICAGAYLFSNTPEYACFKMNGAKAIDIEHDNRGHGIAKFSLTKQGEKVFPEIADREFSYVMYYEGPVFVEADNDSIGYSTLAMMESDVHEEGNAPTNMTNNKPFFIENNYGKGKVFSSIAHPESTPGMRWMIPRMVRYTLNKPLISYSNNSVRPDVYDKEILFSKDMLRKESGMYKTFLYGTEDEKIEALDWLQANMSWSAKRWIQGLLYDPSAKVRARAAKYIADIEYSTYLEDVKAAYSNEKDAEAKGEMKKAIYFLEQL